MSRFTLAVWGLPKENVQNINMAEEYIRNLLPCNELTKCNTMHYIMYHILQQICWKIQSLDHYIQMLVSVFLFLFMLIHVFLLLFELELVFIDCPSLYMASQICHVLDQESVLHHYILPNIHVSGVHILTV